ncbi:hypothetical protein V8B97DRAFT_1951426 [Scleroderma yunnanense]
MSVKAGSTWRSNMPTSDRRYPRCTNPQLLKHLPAHGSWTDHVGTNFYLDIWPTYALSWINNDAYEGHGGKGNCLPMEC